jgi:serine protease Do
MISHPFVTCIACLILFVCSQANAVGQSESPVSESPVSESPVSDATELTSDLTSIETYLAEQSAFKAAVEVARPSVVRIETFGGLSVVDSEQINARTSTGTVVGEDGWIISSLFAFRNDPASTTVLFPDGTRKGAKIIARDLSRELVLLKIEVDQPLPLLVPVEKSDMVIGQWTVAIGRTFSADQVSRSSGILSAKNRIWDKAIQSDAKISPINYGGPLIDLQGRCLGILAPINPGIATEGEVQQWYDSGIGFAVPLTEILDRLPRLQSGEDIYDGKLGVRIASRGDFSSPIELAGVTPGSPAFKSGFKKGDIITEVADRQVSTPNEFKHAIGPFDDKSTVSMTVTRGDETLQIEAELVAEIPVYREPLLGILPSESDIGVVVDAVLPDAFLPEAQTPKSETEGLLEVGDTIVEMNGEATSTIAKLAEQLAFLDFREPAALRVLKKEAASPIDIRVKLGDQSGQLIPDLPGHFSGESEVLKPDGDANAADASESDPNGDPNVGEKIADEKIAARGPSDIVLSDLTNKGFRLVPQNYLANETFGLLVIAPEAGDVNQKAWIDEWEVFCRDHRFVLVVLGAGDDNKWAFEEAEVVRRVMKTQMAKLSLNSRRVCVGGFGTGGTLAFVTAFEDRESVMATFVIQGRVPGLVRMPTNEPLESLRMFIAGDKENYAKVAETFDKQGFAVANVEETIDPASPLNAGAMADLKNWLTLLEWL